MKTSEVLRKALELFGPNGENWVPYPPERKQYCAWTAICEADFVSATGASNVLRGILGGPMESIIGWNDKATWPEVESAFKQAIATAGRGEG